jgi:hypothetical protein
MTSGRGIMHEEMPRRSPEGNIYGFQLWVNLPAALKMSAPRYQEFKADSIPLVHSDGADIRIVAGEVNGVRGPVSEIAADPLYLDVALEPRAVFTYPIPEGHTAIAYVFEGQGTSGQGEPIEAVSLVVFGEGEAVHAQAGAETSLRFMLMAGAPFKEPAVPYGPFVMNTVEEIQQALADLRNGTFVQS